MKYLLFTITVILLFGFDTWQVKPSINQAMPSAAMVLERTATQLNSWQTVKYYHQRDYFTGEQHYLTQGTCFIDFHSTDSIVYLKYQVQSGNETFVFNGSECFTLRQQTKSLKIDPKPQPAGMTGGSFFYNSLVTLRRTLPLIAADHQIRKTLKDTTIDGKSCYLVAFSLFKKTLDAFGGFSPITEARTFSFQLFISKEDYLPRLLIQTNDVDAHSSKVTYSGIEANASVEENSWYYSTYLPAFTIESEKEVALLPVGAKAPAFALPLFGINSRPIQLEHYKDKVLLLEFWIRNCGPCIAAVPKLNRLAKAYKGVELLAINPVDNKSTITYFIENYKATYPIAHKGGKVAEAYGVTAFPAVFVLDRKGTILYSGGFDESAIAKTIQKALQ